MNKGTIVAAISLSALGLGISADESYAQEVGTITASALNVRTGAGTNYSKITTIYKGDKVEILSSANGWYNIRLSNGKTGWASDDYIAKGEISTSSLEISQGKAKVTSSSLNIRKGPSTSYSKVGSLSNGQVVDILEKSGSWSKIKTSNGLIGWVSSTYLTSNISSTNENTQAPSRGVGREAVVELAYKQLGKKYVWGAEGPNTFDCSGLTWYVYKNAMGKTIPRTSIAQSQYGQYVSRSELQPGDLIFSDTDNNGSVNHVGIYIGNGKMIHAPRTGDVVKISDITSGYYKNAYVTSKRP
ncbi:C40 family peptidase [Asaccharospora irregularis]|uniref:SH3 domain protein n=1 Tax=Asaccharospora irregularis DSM 2635 TaxID=1121321 RepID=A0A1M5KBV3_9FIRM|nr:C40 family peptidase [Asaccharospora irregularis]SHG50346.1 SH3 domain protein [Asaccharospora irregularis DSM 2635]